MKIFGSIFLTILIIDLFYVLWDIVRIFRAARDKARDKKKRFWNRQRGGKR